MFVFVIEDCENDVIVVVRDYMGKILMYMVNGKDGSVWFSSEMKIFYDDSGVANYEIFFFGYVYVKKGDVLVMIECWYNL